MTKDYSIMVRAHSAVDGSGKEYALTVRPGETVETLIQRSMIRALGGDVIELRLLCSGGPVECGFEKPVPPITTTVITNAYPLSSILKAERMKRARRKFRAK